MSVHGLRLIVKVIGEIGHARGELMRSTAAALIRGPVRSQEIDLRIYGILERTRRELSAALSEAALEFEPSARRR